MVAGLAAGIGAGIAARMLFGGTPGLARFIEYGLLVVFANVFLEQIGLPIPALLAI